MAFRVEARIGAILAIAVVAAAGQGVTVRHRHLRGGKPGELSVTADGISFVEKGSGSKHTRVWKYEDIQQLELGPDTLRILTYEDRKWELGRDREYRFDQLPPGFAKAVYGKWRDSLDRRFIADLADSDVTPAWVIPAKLLGRIQGSEGTLEFGADRVVYRTARPGQSHTWRFTDIENISSAGPFDFSIAASWASEFHFQLKRILPESRYNQLWRQLNSSKQTHFMQTPSTSD